MGQALNERRDAALGMPGEGEEDLIDPSLLRMREQIIERATGSGAGRAAIGGSMEHTDQMDIGVLLGAQQIEEAGAGALVATHDRHVAGAELPDRRRLPELTGGTAVARRPHPRTNQGRAAPFTSLQGVSVDQARRTKVASAAAKHAISLRSVAPNVCSSRSRTFAIRMQSRTKTAPTKHPMIGSRT